MVVLVHFNGFSGGHGQNMNSNSNSNSKLFLNIAPIDHISCIICNGKLVECGHLEDMMVELKMDPELYFNYANKIKEEQEQPKKDE